MEPLVRDRLTLAAVLGAGIVVGVSGLYVYFKFHNCVGRELNHLTRTIESLRKDIEELKATSSAARQQGHAHQYTKGPRRDVAIVEHASSEAAHLVHPGSSSEENEEYFDVTDDGDINQVWATANGEIPGQDDETTAFLEEIDRLLQGSLADKQEAYNKLLLKKDKDVGNVAVMWRLAKSCSLLSPLESDTDKVKEMIFEGIKYATVAVALDENNAEAHKWYAVLMGRSTDHVGVQDKIKNGHAVREHIDIAIQLTPEDHILYFLKGRWCYGVAMLSWVERKVASTLFGEAPYSTFSEALDQFMEVERIKPNQWKENMLYIAKCLLEERKYSEAVEWLDKAAELPCSAKEDEVAHQEVETLQRKYEGYQKN